MSMASAPSLRPGTTSERIWRYIVGRPVNPDGSVYFRSGDADEAAGAKSAGHASAALTQWDKAGVLTILRHGRRMVGARSKLFAPKGSQTDRIYDVLVAYADERGRVPIDTMTIQRLVGARDQHDTVKALWDLKERGMLSLKEEKVGKSRYVKDIRIRPNASAKASTEVDLDNLPVVVADPEGYVASAAARDPNRKPRHTGPAPVLDEPIERPEPIDETVEPAEATDTTVLGTTTTGEPADPWDLRFPLITAAMQKTDKAKHLQAASAALGAAGPEFEEQAIALLEQAENLITPLEREVIAFIEEVVLQGDQKE